MLHTPLTVLIVDGNPADARRSREMLAGPASLAVPPMRAITSDRIPDALATITREPVDAVLLGLPLADGSGLEAVRLIRRAMPGLPIVIASPPDAEELAFRGVQAGAQDYVIKGLDDGRVLCRAIRHAVERAALARGRDALLYREHDARLAAELASVDADRARSIAESLGRRASFLADAGVALSATLDARATLATATRLAVPMLGDCAVGFMARDDGTLESVETACRDHTHCGRGLAEARALGTCADMATLLRRAERNGNFVLNGTGAVTPGGSSRRAQRVVAAQQWMLVPLQARDRVLGVLALVACGAGRQYDEAELELAEAYAVRAAVAMDNARLYEASRRATRTRDQVLGIVSHDLRNPLSAISMCAVALRDFDGHAPRERERLVTTIHTSAEWTQRLLGDLLDIASIEAGRLSVAARPVDPVVMISHALDLFELTAHEHSLRVVDDMPDVLPSIMGDPQRILQVLANLISNAIKFTPKGGTIRLGVAPSDGTVVFSVADTGPGIAPDHVEHIFDWYWRATHERAERGTGLGLAIAKGIVDAHGGRIWVASAPGEGTTISFSVPVVTSSPPKARRAPREREAAVPA